MTWLSSKLGDFKKDKSLDWSRKKQQIKGRIKSELFGMPKKQQEVYLDKVGTMIDNAAEVKKELEGILSRFYVEE